LSATGDESPPKGASALIQQVHPDNEAFAWKKLLSDANKKRRAMQSQPSYASSTDRRACR